nr:MAG TPA: Protein of unknown function (DUF551) [Caudoviricetes sp.]
MSTITKEWLQQKIADMEATRDEIPFGLDEDDSNTLAALRIALASLEAEPVAYMTYKGYLLHAADPKLAEYSDPTPLYTAPPAPVSVPAAMEMDDDFDSAFEHGKAVGWNAYRAAMLQGSDGTLTNEGTITATQFKPVADLYGLTSPTGGETSFTFDAVEARDFVDGGWSCQEYVELGRYQEALTDHSEDKLAMVDHSGDSNNMVEPVTTANKLLDGWVACSERMPEDDDFVYIWPRPDFGVELHVGQYCECHPKGDGWYAQVYEQNYGIEWCSITVTHWMPLPAAPQQEVTQALAKGMERYGDAMQKLADSGD